MADIIGLDGKEVKTPPKPRYFKFTFHSEEAPVLEAEGFLSVTPLFLAVVDGDDNVLVLANTADVRHVEAKELEAA